MARMLHAFGLPCLKSVVTDARCESIILSMMLVSAMLVCKLLDPLFFYECEEQQSHQITTFWDTFCTTWSLSKVIISKCIAANPSI